MSNRTFPAVEQLDVGYPVFAAKFLSDDRLVIAGGGGEGNNGIRNKISVLDVDLDAAASSSVTKKPIQISTEVELPRSEDNPTSIDISQEVSFSQGRQTQNWIC